jgi:hypothetical protein
LGITKNSAGADSVIHEDCTEFLMKTLARYEEKRNWKTNGFSHVLWKVGDVQIGRGLIAFSLETGIERLLHLVSINHPEKRREKTNPSKANFIAKLVETPNTEL